MKIESLFRSFENLLFLLCHFVNIYVYMNFNCLTQMRHGLISEAQASIV